MHRSMRGAALAVAVAAIAAIGVVSAQPARSTTDWPQWRGPDRSGRSAETGLLQQWPASGPRRLWTVNTVGAGYGSIAVADDRIFVQGTTGARQSAVFALNRADGKGVWSKAIGPAGNNDRGPGPRSTPTVDGDRVYVLTENGDLACLRAADGTSVWQRNILRDFNARNIDWQISESPLVDGARVYVTPGGPRAAIVALDKLTGATVWTSTELNDQAGYASLVAADVQGVRVLTTLTAQAGVGVRASDGKLLWRYRAVANQTANIATPVVHDNKVFYTSGYDTGGALLGLTAKGTDVIARELYFTRNMQNHHGGVVLVGEHLYGFHDAILACLEFATGRVLWRNRSVGKGSLIYADNHLYVLGEDQVMGLVEATPAAYREKGRFRLADEGLPTWALPVVSGGTLYLRNQRALSAYGVK